MPVPFHSDRAGESEERLRRLEREVERLCGDAEEGQRLAAGEGRRAALMGWLTMVMAALGLFLSLLALLRA